MKLIDLSYPVDNRSKIHPLDSPAFLFQEKFIERDDFNLFRLEMGLHTGTHIDAPMHLTDNKKFINEYDLNRFCGSAVLIDVRGQNIIEYRECYNNLIKEDQIVLFYTGHEKKYGEEEYFTSHPVIDIKLAEFLVIQKIKMTGFDLPSPDNEPYPVHRLLLENEIMIIENLKNLENLINKEFKIFAFPLNVKSDSSISRVVAELI
jgi:kynurenine formamidase